MPKKIYGLSYFPEFQTKHSKKQIPVPVPIPRHLVLRHSTFRKIHREIDVLLFFRVKAVVSKQHVSAMKDKSLF